MYQSIAKRFEAKIQSVYYFRSALPYTLLVVREVPKSYKLMIIINRNLFSVLYLEGVLRHVPLISGWRAFTRGDCYGMIVAFPR